MLAEADDGTLRPSEGSIVTPHEVSVLAVHNYHQAMLARATEALEFDPEDRHFGAVTVAVPVSSVAGLKEAIAAFQERVLDLCDSAEAPAERVYQLNLQLFPLSTHIAPPAPPPTEGT
jgi:uncharacterized protein (TIGR02147 family)